jgi:hypothetical protein
MVGLGTNGGVTTQQVQQLMAIVGVKREVILVNTLVPPRVRPIRVYEGTDTRAFGLLIGGGRDGVSHPAGQPDAVRSRAPGA